MNFLNEEVMDNVRLTSHQKSILATIAQSEDGSVPDDILSSNINLSGALKQLLKMNMVYNARDDRYSATDLGKKFAQQADIIDDSGEITDIGNKMVLGTNAKNESVGNFKNYLKLI